jgi:hypothetical protein
VVAGFPKRTCANQRILNAFESLWRVPPTKP